LNLCLDCITSELVNAIVTVNNVLTRVAP